MAHILPPILPKWNNISYRNFTVKRTPHFPHNLHGILPINNHFLNQRFQPILIKNLQLGKPVQFLIRYFLRTRNLLHPVKFRLRPAPGPLQFLHPNPALFNPLHIFLPADLPGFIPLIQTHLRPFPLRQLLCTVSNHRIKLRCLITFPGFPADNPLFHQHIRHHPHLLQHCILNLFPADLHPLAVILRLLRPAPAEILFLLPAGKPQTLPAVSADKEQIPHARLPPAHVKSHKVIIRFPMLTT